MTSHNIDLIIFCDERPAYNVYINAAKTGLAAQLKEGQLPAPFIKLTEASDAHISVWRLP